MVIKLLPLLMICIALSYAALPSTSWVRNNGLTGRLFGNPLFEYTSRGRLDCGMRCSGEACCRTLTFNPTTKSCTGYCRRKTTGDPFTSDPGREVYHWIHPPNGHTCVYDTATDICFSLKTDLKTKYEAADQCQRYNGHLIWMNTVEKLSAVEVVLRAYYTNNAFVPVCIDGEDFDNNHNYKMSNGQTLSLTSALWSSGEPNGLDEDCVNVQSNYRLNDVPCLTKMAYLCEY